MKTRKRKQDQARGNTLVNNHHGIVKHGLEAQIYPRKKNKTSDRLVQDLFDLAQKHSNKNGSA